MSILRQLEKNSRIAFSKLGKKIKASEQTTSYNVKSLIEKKIIKKFYPRIDYATLGLLNFRVYFNVSYVNETKFDELIIYFIKNKYTSLVASCGGKYDLVVSFLCLNPSQFDRILREIMEKFPDILSNHTVLTTIAIKTFGRKYLYSNKESYPKEHIIGGDKALVNIDKIDNKILKLLNEDARQSLLYIAQITGITAKTVIARIKRLVDLRVIQSFHQLLDLSKADYSSSKLLIKYHNISTKTTNQLVSFLKFHPNVKHVIKTIGEWDLEIEIESNDKTGLRKIEIEIRKKFGLLIKDIESIRVYETHKISFYSNHLSEK